MRGMGGECSWVVRAAMLRRAVSYHSGDGVTVKVKTPTNGRSIY